MKRVPMNEIMSEVVIANGIAFLAGNVANDPNADMQMQTAQVLENIEATLTKIGATKDSVLSATVYLTDMKQKPAMNAAWTAFFNPEHLPARATVEVSDLDGYLVEIVVTAAVNS